MAEIGTAPFVRTIRGDRILSFIIGGLVSMYSIRLLEAPQMVSIYSGKSSLLSTILYGLLNNTIDRLFILFSFFSFHFSIFTDLP